MALGKDVDFALIPGVAFDGPRRSRRATAKAITTSCSKACGRTARWSPRRSKCQLFDEVPTLTTTDVFMDFVVTENRVLEGLGRGD